MMHRFARMARAGLAVLVFAGSAATAAAQEPCADGSHRSLRVLGGATRFVPPVNTVEELQRSMSRPAIQRDIDMVLDKAGLGSLKEQVRQALSEGNVTEMPLPVGETMEWMALRRNGTPEITRCLAWRGVNGRDPLPGYSFTVTVEEPTARTTYTFFVPKICGNISLVARMVTPVLPPPVSDVPEPEPPPVAQTPPPKPVAPPPDVPPSQPPQVCGPITGSARSTPLNRSLSKLKMELLDGGKVTNTTVTDNEGRYSLDPGGGACGQFVVRCVDDRGRVIGTSDVAVKTMSPTADVICAVEAPFPWKKVLLGAGAAAAAIGSAAVIATDGDASGSR